MRKRRRSAGDETEGVPGEEAPAPTVEGPRAQGPWDASELRVDEDDQTRAHLGALSVEGNPEMELRLQVDEASGQVQAVMLIGSDGAMELRAFAAPRNEDIWDEVRAGMVEEAGRHGGRTQDVDGPYGTALHLEIPAVGPDGKQVKQRSTVLGISGPRWLLRVSMYGRPATDFRPDGVLETALRSVVVNRGTQPMRPKQVLPLTLPAGARRMNTPAGPE